MKENIGENVKKVSIYLMMMVMSLNVSFAFDTKQELTENVLVEEILSGFSQHNTEGVVQIIEKEGRKIIRLKNFKTDNGPNLEVYLSESRWPQNIVNLGDLKSFEGDQEYAVDNNEVLTGLNHVIIWCAEFNILFGYAEFQDLK